MIIQLGGCRDYKMYPGFDFWTGSIHWSRIPSWNLTFGCRLYRNLYFYVFWVMPRIFCHVYRSTYFNLDTSIPFTFCALLSLRCFGPCWKFHVVFSNSYFLEPLLNLESSLKSVTTSFILKLVNISSLSIEFVELHSCLWLGNVLIRVDLFFHCSTTYIHIINTKIYPIRF